MNNLYYIEKNLTIFNKKNNSHEIDIDWAFVLLLLLLNKYIWIKKKNIHYIKKFHKKCLKLLDSLKKKCFIKLITFNNIFFFIIIFL